MSVLNKNQESGKGTGSDKMGTWGPAHYWSGGGPAHYWGRRGASAKLGHGGKVQKYSSKNPRRQPKAKAKKVIGMQGGVKDGKHPRTSQVLFGAARLSEINNFLCNGSICPERMKLHYLITREDV